MKTNEDKPAPLDHPVTNRKRVNVYRQWTEYHLTRKLPDGRFYLSNWNFSFTLPRALIARRLVQLRAEMRREIAWIVSS